MYRFYNANALGKFEEDCTVRSISCATGKSWDQVYDELSNVAQINGTMMDNREFIIDYLDSRFERINVRNKTVGQVSDMFPYNTILITMSGHITCSKSDKYGEPTIYDTFDCRGRQAEYVWIVK